MKYPFFNLSVCLILICISTSCNKKSEVEYTDTPVLEAYITPGSVFVLKVSRQTPFSAEAVNSADDISNLDIQLIQNGSHVHLTPAGEGYYTDSSIQINEKDEFDVEFHFNGKQVSATTRIPSHTQNITQSVTQIAIERMSAGSGPPSGTMPDPVKLTWDNPDGSYYLVVVENLETVLDPIRDFGDNEDRPSFRFRKTPVKASGDEIRPMEFQYYGLHRIVLFHVLPDYAALYNQSSNSSQNLSNPSTEIVNGYGIFTGLNSDTLFITVKE